MTHDQTPPPAWLSPVAADKWRELMPTMSGHNFVRSTDLDLLGQYCSQFAAFTEAEQAIQNEGTVRRSKAGNAYPSAWLAIRNDASFRMTELAKLLGFSPDSPLPGRMPPFSAYVASALPDDLSGYVVIDNDGVITVLEDDQQ